MKNTKVVIIDDDKEFLNELQESLGSSGYEITPVSNAKNALDITLQRNPDVILMDLKMPGKSGFELADEMRHASPLANVPIIAMSAFFREDFNALASLCGINQCLRKPFQTEQAISAIEGAVKE